MNYVETKLKENLEVFMALYRGKCVTSFCLELFGVRDTSEERQ